MKWPVSGIAGFFFRMDTQAKAEVRTTKTFILVRSAEKETRYIPGDPGEGTVPAPIMTPVVLLFLKTR
jgi:hypothetical protein